MEEDLLWAIAVFAVVIGLGYLAKKIKVPYPIALVIGGLLLSLFPVFYPHLPTVVLEPNLIFLTVLPPILFAGGYFTSVGGFRRNAFVIALLAIGLVIATAAAVAGLAHGYSGMIWPAAFALGAIVSPPDATAAMAITQRLKISHKVVSILDGESLVNDATALIFYRFSLVALATGVFSWSVASIDFVWICCSTIVMGLVVAAIASWVTQRLDDTCLSIGVSLITAYLSYVLAYELVGSGVLSAVAAGLYMGWKVPRTIDPIINIEAVAFWKTFIFLIDGAVFMLIGLQLPAIIDDLARLNVKDLVLYPIYINLVLILVRFAFVFGATYLPIRIFPRLKNQYLHLTWRHSLVLSWSGMRGVVSLAAAMAIPIVLGGTPIHDRSLIIYLTFTVIFFTLVVQGLTLPFLIRFLGLVNQHDEDLDEAKVRLQIAKMAVDHLHKMHQRGDLELEQLQRLLRPWSDASEAANEIIEERSDEKVTKARKHYVDAQLEILKLQRAQVLELHRDGGISTPVMRKILGSIDFDVARLSGLEI